MKSINVEEKHRNYLVEMNKHFFSKRGNYINKEYVQFWKDDNWINIHWLEFSLLYLIKEISKFKTIKEGKEIYRKFNGCCTTSGRRELHPIDYLYNEYTKLNIKLNEENKIY